MKFGKNKVTALILALVMAIGALGASALADNSPTYDDVPEDYWGYEAISKWSTAQYNVLQGYGNGKFGPEDYITAEQLAWINGRILGIADKDAAYTGTGSRALTRAEAVAVIAKAFGIEPLNSANKPFADEADIPASYRGYVDAMRSAGYVQGVGSNTFAPNTYYTRAQALQVIYNMTTDILDKNASNVTAAKNIVIRKAGTTLSKATIDGDLIIGQGVGDGEVILNDVTVNGKVLVLGGGSNSIVIRGASKMPNVSIAKASGQPARIKVEGAAVVGEVAVAQNCAAIVNGSVSTVIAEGGNTLQLQSAKVNSVVAEGSGITLTVDSSSTVAAATVEASNVKIQGTGKVTKVTVTADAKSGVVVDTKGSSVSVAAGAGNVTDSSGSVVAKTGSTATTAGTSSGGGGSSSSGSSGGNGGSGSGS